MSVEDEQLRHIGQLRFELNDLRMRFRNEVIEAFAQGANFASNWHTGSYKVPEPLADVELLSWDKALAFAANSHLVSRVNRGSDVKLDSAEGIAKLVEFAKAGNFVLSKRHRELASKYGVDVNNVIFDDVKLPGA